MIKVVSKRNNSPVPENTIRVYIGRPTTLGNPFIVGKHGERGECVDKYSEWIMALPKDGAIWQEIKRIHGLSKLYNIELECWCAPKKCHGDVVKKLLETIR